MSSLLQENGYATSQISKNLKYSVAPAHHMWGFDPWHFKITKYLTFSLYVWLKLMSALTILWYFIDLMINREI